MGNNLNELLISVNRGAQTAVVIVPFLSLDSTTGISVAKLSQVIFKNLVFGLLTAYEFRMFYSRVNSFHVSSCDNATTIFIHLRKRFVNDILTSRAHFTTNTL